MVPFKVLGFPFIFLKIMVKFQDLEMTLINMIIFSQILITFSNIKLILKYKFI